MTLLRCGHAVEFLTLFKNPDEGMRNFDETFSKTMRKMWVQFAKIGDPSLSADISPDGKEKVWPLYDLKDKMNWICAITDTRGIHIAIDGKGLRAAAGKIKGERTRRQPPLCTR